VNQFVGIATINLRVLQEMPLHCGNGFYAFEVVTAQFLRAARFMTPAWGTDAD